MLLRTGYVLAMDISLRIVRFDKLFPEGKNTL
jgi:hypothetical protein